MNSDPVDNRPHFFARSRTPESPRPVHIPEPSTIPVLENQIDPIFNLMTTHLNPPFAARNMTAIDHDLATIAAARNASLDPSTTSNEVQAENQHSEGTQSKGEEQVIVPTAQDATGGQELSDSSLNIKQLSSLTAQPTVSVDSFEPSPPANIQPSPSASHLVIETHVPSHSPFVEDDKIEEGTDSTHNSVAGAQDSNSAEVNYQALLDNIGSPKTLGGTTTSDNHGNTPSQAPQSPHIPAPSSTSLSSSNIPSSAGLPPRPPPQEKPAIHPNYVPGEDIRAYHFPSMHHPAVTSSQNTTSSNSYRPSPYPAHMMSPMTGTSSNGLPPPPLPSFQQPQIPFEATDRSPLISSRMQDDLGPNPERGSRDDTERWPPHIQQKYDQFLKDEEVYTKEGAWDKFPQGSRLFVGNLPTEVVTKRDIFHIFHRFGRLAQISIKQAYGFVQFMDQSACMAALQAEQGGKIKDRSMHLEVSKPPKNSRNAATAAGEKLRADHYRRSQSPTKGRPGSRGVGGRNGDRYGGGRNPPFSDFRDEPRRRDDYRPGRSPSPRGYRGRERDSYRGGRDRSPGRYRDRSRSPYGGSRYNRSPSPRRRSIDEEEALPIPRRHPRDVPDVQIILMDDLERSFIDYVEKPFRDRGLRSAVLMLPNVPLNALIKRQAREGAHAVVKLYRRAREIGRIPVLIFDRSNPANVRFEEYGDDLDPATAAELVVRAKAKATTSTATATAAILQNQFSLPANFPIQQLNQAAAVHHQQLPQQGQQQPGLANLITSLDGPALQKLLSAMQQSPTTPQQPQAQHPLQSPASGQQPDLQALLGTITNQQQQGPLPQQPQSHGLYGYPQVQQQQQQPGSGYGYGAYGGGQQQSPSQSGFPQGIQIPLGGAGGQNVQNVQNVQSVLEQIGRWKQ